MPTTITAPPAPHQPVTAHSIVKAASDHAWLNERRVDHGVTPVQAVDPDRLAYRDVLVVTCSDTATIRRAT